MFVLRARNIAVIGWELPRQDGVPDSIQNILGIVLNNALNFLLDGVNLPELSEVSNSDKTTLQLYSSPST